MRLRFPRTGKHRELDEEKIYFPLRAGLVSHPLLECEKEQRNVCMYLYTLPSYFAS